MIWFWCADNCLPVVLFWFRCAEYCELDIVRLSRWVDYYDLISVCLLLRAGYFRPGFGLPIIESDFGLLIILI